MAETLKEISNATLKEDSESVIDAALNGKQDDGKTSAEDNGQSSNEEGQEESKEEGQEAGADQQKTADDTDKESKEESGDKEEGKEESKDPRDLAFRKGYNEAKAKLLKEIEALKSTALPSEKVEEFNRIVNSSEFVRLSMKSQGFTDEAINRKLGELGHKVEEKSEDALTLVLDKLGFDMSKASEEQKSYVNTYLADVVKIADVLMNERLSKILPNAIKPIQDQLGSMNKASQSAQTMANIKKTVEGEGVLDYAKDVEPELEKWLDQNEKTKTSEDFVKFFYELNHKKTVERLKLGKRKEERDGKKGDLRNLGEGAGNKGSGKLPKWDKDKDAGDNVAAMLDGAGILQ